MAIILSIIIHTLTAFQLYWFLSHPTPIEAGWLMFNMLLSIWTIVMWRSK